MMSKSCISLVDLASGDMKNVPSPRGRLPRTKTAQGIVSDTGSNERNETIESNGGDLDDTSVDCCKRIIIAADLLPLNGHKDLETNKWSFYYDEDSLLLQMKDGISANTEVVYVGSLGVNVDIDEQEEVSQKLLNEFNCVPTFFRQDLHKKFYDGFCKHQLWPLFHYMMPMGSDHCSLFDRDLWLAYVSANKIFADKVMEVINPEEDYVWIHDYHLMILPTFLRKRFMRVKLGFFLHTPFPISEIYRTLPVSFEIIKALLNADLVGFQTFEYARNFLSCCSRMLGLDYENRRGDIGIDYLGRTVYIRILPIGIHMGRAQSTLNHTSSSIKVREIQEQFKDRILIVGDDDMDIFKGINLKLLAMERLLQGSMSLRGKVVLVQIINPPRSSGKDVDDCKRELYSTAKRINVVFGSPGYEPVVLIYRAVSPYEKTAYFALAECCIVNAVRDGMNLIAYEYVVSRQRTPKIDEAMGITSGSPHTSALVVSEFVGCSPSLSGAIRVNPWNIEDVAEALHTAILMPEMEKQLRHDKHYRFVSSHDISYWARSFIHHLERSCKYHYSKFCWGIGFGLNFRILSLSPSFSKLSIEDILSAYKRMDHRAIFLDYDGTMVSQTSIVKTPSPEVISVINDLCNDTKNTVFVVSGRGKDSLVNWFAECPNLGIAAEHGYFMRWSSDSNWATGSLAVNFHWKRMAEPVLKLYTEATDGSYIETKESALVWHHQDADPEFGSSQAKELLDHLENVLAKEPAVVKRGKHIVEVKPKGVTKGMVAEKVLSKMTSQGNPADFVLCIGDDRSDEDMFESILNTAYAKSLNPAPEIFACTVGQKPSKARYYLDDTREVMALLKALASASRMTTKA